MLCKPGGEIVSGALQLRPWSADLASWSVSLAVQSTYRSSPASTAN
jgi:hypothetical protein